MSAPDTRRRIAAVLDERVALTPDAPMVIHGDRQLTFAELAARADRVRTGLAAAGFGPGSTVAWQLPTSLDAVVLCTALALGDITQIPLLPVLRQRELRFIASEAKPQLLIVPRTYRGFDHAALAEEIAGGADGLDVMVLDEGLPEAEPSERPALAGLPVRWIYYTSGTTGVPKGVKHRDDSLLAAAWCMAGGFRITQSDVAPIAFPFSHIGGSSWLGTMLFTGAVGVLDDAFDPTRSVPAMAAVGGSLLGGGTVFCEMILAQERREPGSMKAPRLRAFLAGGAPKPAGLHAELKATFGGAGCLSSYGMTECPVMTCGTPDDPDAMLATTEGRPGPGVELAVVRADGSLAAPGEEGELRVVAAPQLMSGYVDSSLETDVFDESGRFRTGDLGRVDADGYVSITGRLKDVIIRKGENVSAKEIEDILALHPKVGEVAVIGLPDARSGERVCAVVAPRAAGLEPSFTELTQFLEAQGLMRQKLPEQLEFLEALPRNPTGKVLKHELRARYSNENRFRSSV